MDQIACILLERGKKTRLFIGKLIILTTRSDGNIRYYEYENDKFEYLSEHKSAEPQRGIAFLPRRGINVRAEAMDSLISTPLTSTRSMRTKS